MPVPPKSVQANARKGLELRREHGRGGTGVGVARARNLSNGDDISESTLARMRSYFARHEVDSKAEGWESESNPSAGWIAWLLWGGDAGRRWAESFREDADAVRYEPIRFDALPGVDLKAPKRLDDGAWLVQGIAAVEGVKTYGARRELATYEALTARLDAYEGIGTDIEHQHGIHTPGSQIKRTGVVTKAVGIPAARAVVLTMRLDSLDKTKRGLSVGYRDVQLRETPGVYARTGERYDAVQTALIPNHVTQTDSPRVREAYARLDSLSKTPKPTEATMAQITIDGVVAEVPDAFAAAWRAERTSAQQRLDSANAQVTTITQERDKAAGELAAAKAQLEQRLDSKAVNAAVKARVALLTEATPHLSEDDTKRLDSMTDVEVKRAVVTKAGIVLPEGSSDDVVAGAYVGALSILGQRMDADDAQRRSLDGPSNGNGGGDRLDNAKTPTLFDLNAQLAGKTKAEA